MTRLLITLLFLTAAGQAHAAPVVIAIAAYAASAITVTQLVITVGMYIYGTMQQRKAEKKARNAQEAERLAHNASLRDRTVTQIASEAPYVYVYGRARVGSAIQAIFKSGVRDQWKHLVCVHAAHECDAFEEIWIAGKKLADLDSEGFVTAPPFSKTTTGSGFETHNTSSFTLEHTPVGGVINPFVFIGAGDDRRAVKVPYTIVGRNVTLTLPPGFIGSISVNYQYKDVTPYVNVQRHLGTPDDPVDAYLHTITKGQWKETAVLRGFCYTVVTLNLDEPEFQGGLPSIEVVLRGKKLYDPRTGLTEWSENNSLAIRDYLIGEVCAVPAEDIPDDDVITAANVCDEVLGSGIKRFTFNGAVSSDEEKSAVLNKMAESMAGGIVSTSWEMYAGKYVAPVMDLYQEDIVGDLALTPGLSDADIYNGVRGRFISPENGYVTTDFRPYQNPAYVAADNGRELWSNIDFPYTNTLQAVWNLSRIFTEDQRQAFTISATFSLKTWRLRVGQRVTLTSEVFGWNAKVFRVTDKKFSPDGPVHLVLKEDGPTIWDEADSVTPDDTPNTDLQDPFFVPALESLTCESGTDFLIAKDGTVISRIRVSWPPVNSQSVKAIEIEWRTIDSDVWTRVSVTGIEAETFISPVEDGMWYVVRARTANPYLNLQSDWTYAEDHEVIGKTQPPRNIQQLSIAGTVLSWAPSIELDIAGAFFRFHYGNNLDWNSAAPLNLGLIVSSPFDLITRPAGIVTIMGKWKDTSGNESVNAAYVVTDLGDAPVANVVEVFDFWADGFPGDITGGEVEVGTGDLIADETDSFYGALNQSFYGADGDSFYRASSYGQLVYVTEEVVLAQPLNGAVMTLVIETQGSNLTIEYRLSDPTPLYGADGDSFYGPDADPFYGEPSTWLPWPGQISATYDSYQFQATIGSGSVQGRVSKMQLIVDAPDMVEYIEDILIDAAGTPVPYTMNFTAIKTVTATLQANASGAETLEVDKSNPLFPELFAYNSSHTAVSGASADATIKGY